MTINQRETKINPEIALLPIASILKALKILSKTLLNYEKEGIVNSEKNGEKRYYGLDDLERGRHARFLTKNKIMKLEGVKIFISVLKKTDIKPEDYFNSTQRILKLQKNN